MTSHSKIHHLQTNLHYKSKSTKIKERETERFQYPKIKSLTWSELHILATIVDQTQEFSSSSHHRQEFNINFGENTLKKKIELTRLYKVEQKK